MTLNNNLTIRELTLDDLADDLLKHFNRFQEVKRAWRKENDQYILKDICFTEHWDENEKLHIVKDEFHDCIKNGGTILGGFDDNKLIAFACIENKLFGSYNQYLQLSKLHVSNEYRNYGLGKRLFMLCCEIAKEKDAKKLYISANSSEETQAFYVKRGCVEAVEINKELAEKEPYDCQMEYVL